MKKVLILGVGGQDGSYLTRNLVNHGSYEVHGLYRHSSINNLTRVHDLVAVPNPAVKLYRGDITDPFSVGAALAAVKPDYVYNLADQDNVSWSKEVLTYGKDVTYGGAAVVMECVRRLCPEARVFQPISATVFGEHPGPTQDEQTPFDPRSPYAVAKTAAYYLARYYREEYGMFVGTAIFYNHDSVLRTEQYLLHKICRSVVRIARGKQKTMALGNLDTVVDIGHAPEYAEAARRIAELDRPEDFVIGTGRGFRIGQLVNHAFGLAGIPEGDRLIETDPAYYRPRTGNLVADPNKARTLLRWHPAGDAMSLIPTLLDLAYSGGGL